VLPGCVCCKTFQAFVKPVAAVVKERIDAWERLRPGDQAAALLDERPVNECASSFSFEADNQDRRC
jgi:hypothetical protein